MGVRGICNIFVTFAELSSGRELKKDPAKPAVGTISVKYPALGNVALARDVYICMRGNNEEEILKEKENIPEIFEFDFSPQRFFLDPGSRKFLSERTTKIFHNFLF